MGRLFWKILIWFWFAMILTNVMAILIIAQFLWTPDKDMQNIKSPDPNALMSAVASVLKNNNVDAKNLLENIIASSSLNVFVINGQGEELFDNPLTAFDTIETKNLSGNIVELKQRNILKRNVLTSEGEHYTIIVEPKIDGFIMAPGKPPIPFARAPHILLVRFIAALLFGGLVCAWLAWHLTKPVRQLSAASHKLANGDLNVRVSGLIGQRRDEISDLGHDFDYMAEHLQVMINGQQQLLQNISHELRSPLARMHVAMGLAQKKDRNGVKRELDRIEIEANRLESLIAQILTLSKQQENNVNSLEEYIDLASLLKTIVADAEYEVTNKKCHVSLECKINPIIRANGELLHRALENIIRNAVRYTANATTVCVVLQNNAHNDCINISICDFGPGVPENFLSSLFEPFVRVADSRDRNSGGYGLGLAITRHAIVLHSGSVQAYNREGGGLCVEVELPLHLQ